MIKKYLLLFVLGATHILFCFPQEDQNTDSLLAVLNNQQNDSNKVNTLNALSKQFLKAKNISDAKKYAEDALSLAEKIDFKNGIVNADVSIGNIYNRQGATYYYEANYPEALKNYLAALKIFEKNQPKRETANALRNIGLVYWRLGHYADALRNLSNSLSIFKEIQDKNAIARAYNDIGNVYENQANYSEALKNYLVSLKIYDEAGNKRAMVSRYFNIALLYEDQGNYPEALKNYSAALNLCKELENTEKECMAACYSNIGSNYLQQGTTQADPKQQEELYDKALEYQLAALKNYKESGDKEKLAVCYNAIGETYLILKNFAKAKQFLNDGLSLFKEVGTIDGSKERRQAPAVYIRETYRLLARLDSTTGNWKGAFYNHKQFIFYSDSVLNEENANKILKVQMQFDFDKKEDSLKYQQTLTDEKLKQQTLLTHQQSVIKNSLLAGLALFIVLSFFIYRNYRTRQQLKLQTLRNKIASDLHDDVGSTLSSISIFSQMAQQQSKEVIPLLETIEESSKKMLDAMADIVWTINPENDQFEKIILRMRSFAYELLGAKKIDFEFLAGDDVAKMKLPMDVRKNLYLIFKEATNNMVKYAEANKAMFAIKGEKNNLSMLIRDNGKGFDTNQSAKGNGLKNMKKRAEEIKGQLTIDSLPGNGTTIQLSVAL